MSDKNGMTDLLSHLRVLQSSLFTVQNSLLSVVKDLQTLISLTEESFDFQSVDGDPEQLKTFANQLQKRFNEIHNEANNDLS
jgi:hypothetical protein